MSDLRYLRELDDAQLEAFVGVAAAAFAVDVDAARAWIDAAGRELVRAVSLDGRVVGGLLFIPMGQCFGGRSVPMLGLAGVCVAMDQRRRGVAQRMLRATLDEARERGLALSTLYASNHKLYGSVGYAPAGSRFLARLDPSAVDPRLSSGPLRAASAQDYPVVEALYGAAAARTPGFLDRGGYIWPRVRETRRGLTAHGLLLLDEDSGEPCGYVYVRLRSEGEWQVLEITDAVAADAATWRRVWGAVNSVGTMVRRIEWSSAPHDPLYLALEHARAELRLHENWMLRVVDARGALEARGYASALSLSIDVELHDDGRDAERLHLEVSAGGARCSTSSASVAPSVRLDARGLAALYSGFAAPALLRQRGLLEGGDAAADEALGALFAGPAPWMREAF
ncbi:MAG: GNAT family N-acetyltransferase [Myxococcales bacterium]|nr:GNAT family N-acetyltransferase [Myxococcales bacterium]